MHLKWSKYHKLTMLVIKPIVQTQRDTGKNNIAQIFN